MTNSEHAEPTEADATAPEPSAADIGDTVDEKTASPILEHLDETMESARQAADEALAPQRD